MASLLEVQHLTKRFGSRTLFHDISLSIAEGQRVGLIARNGEGKSTLLSILAGHEAQDEGTIVMRRDATVALLEQSPAFDPEETVIDACLSRTGELAELISRYERALATPDSPELMGLIEEMERREAWNLEQRAKRILSILHIDRFDQPMGQLSGGQRKRVALANALLSEADLLILDEPTNHLDLTMIEWLEDYLKRSSKALLLVTHDRYFLENVCSTILELADEGLYSYEGNYQYYLEKRQERLDVADATLAKARNLYRKELDWIRRMPQARGGKAKYRKDAFARLSEQVSVRREERAARLDVAGSYIGSKVFEAEYVSKAFPVPASTVGEEPHEKVILKDFTYTFARYEKLGIIGGNGTGKSTFIKLLLGLEHPDSGRFVIGETVRFGYFSQDGMTFSESDKVIDAVRKHAEYIDTGIGGKRLSASQFLTHFLFAPSRQQDYIYKLSGGERRRLQLCIVLMKAPNFLILDEPTNDLDIATLQVLEDYLENFRGCVIVVSHDRYFMDRIVDHLLVFEGEGKITDFPGNYTQYREWADAREAQAREEKQRAPRQVEDKKPARPATERPRRLTYKERQELTALEQEIETLTAEKEQLETAVCSGTLSPDELREQSARIPDVMARLDEKENRWLELSEIAEGGK